MTPSVSDYAAAGHITITCEDVELNSFPAVITSLSEGGIVRVRVPCTLPEGARVEIHAGLDHPGVGTVLYSIGANDQHWATIQIHRDDRRREPRIPVDTSARIVVFHSGMTLTADARITDVSKSGLGLVTDLAVPCNVLLKVILAGAIVFAEIRYCREAGGTVKSYKIGALIQTVILSGEADPDWMHTPEELWGSLALAVRKFEGNS